MKRCATRNRRGFATIIALTLLALVAVAVAALAVAFAADARRSANVAADAQLRQLLLIGAAALPEQLDRHAMGGMQIPLPKELIDQGALLKVSIESGSGEVRRAEVEARLGNRIAWQTLTLTRQSNRWSIISADLGAS